LRFSDQRGGPRGRRVFAQKVGRLAKRFISDMKDAISYFGFREVFVR